MYVKPVRPPDVVADAISRAVVGPSWSGSLAELHAAIDAAAVERERAAPDWPRSAVALGACLRSQSDALRAHGLRLSLMPDALLIERLHRVANAEPAMPGHAATPRHATLPRRTPTAMRAA